MPSRGCSLREKAKKNLLAVANELDGFDDASLVSKSKRTARSSPAFRSGRPVEPRRASTKSEPSSSPRPAPARAPPRQPGGRARTPQNAPGRYLRCARLNPARPNPTRRAPPGAPPGALREDRFGSIFALFARSLPARFSLDGDLRGGAVRGERPRRWRRDRGSLLYGALVIESCIMSIQLAKKPRLERARTRNRRAPPNLAGAPSDREIVTGLAPARPRQDAVARPARGLEPRVQRAASERNLAKAAMVRPLDSFPGPSAPGPPALAVARLDDTSLVVSRRGCERRPRSRPRR